MIRIPTQLLTVIRCRYQSDNIVPTRAEYINRFVWNYSRHHCYTLF